MTLMTPANQSQRWHFRAAEKPPGNFLTQYSLEMSEAQAGNRTYPKWQQARLSHNSSLHYFSALGLSSCQGGNEHEGPDLHVLTVQRTGEWFTFINVTSCTEEPLCSPVLQDPFPPESVLHRLPRMDETPDAAHITGPVTPCGCSKALAPRETLNISHCPAPALLQRYLNVGRKTRLSFTRKTRS